MDRHTRHLGWGCPFQQCRLSTSIPRDNWQSDQHIDKAHDEMYEPLRPLALPRPAGLPTPTYSANFRTLQPAWTLLLACPKASTRQHSKPLPSQIHQPPAAAAGMIGAVPPVFEPGCHPWNVMHPILDDLEPHAVPLFGVEPLGQETWIDLEELSLEERGAPEVSDPSEPTANADGPTDIPINTLDDPIDVDEDSSSGFVTPPLPPERTDTIDVAVISSALSKVTSERKEVLVQTESLVGDMRSAAPPSASSDGESHLAGTSINSSRRSPSIGYSRALPTSTSSLFPSGLQTLQREGEPSESREAGVQAGQSMTEMSNPIAVEPRMAESDAPSKEVNTSDVKPMALPTSPTSAAAAAAAGPAPKSLDSTELEMQADSDPSELRDPLDTGDPGDPGDPALGLAPAAKEVRSSTPPPPYTY